MGEIKLKYFSIVKDSGQSLISLNIDEKLDDNLIGGFLTALFSFGTSSLKEQLAKLSIESNHMRIDSMIYNCESGYNLIAIGFLTPDVESKYFRVFAESVLKDFCNKFNKYLERWDGELSIFKSYKMALIKRIKETFTMDEEAYNRRLDDAFSKILDGDLSGLDEI